MLKTQSLRWESCHELLVSHKQKSLRESLSLQKCQKTQLYVSEENAWGNGLWKQ